MNKFDFNNKTVIITGASSGIGKELATILINDYNATVLAIARDEQKLNLVKNSFGSKSDNFKVYPFDVSLVDNWKSFYNTLILNSITIDVLINCAGVLPKFNRFENVTVKDFEKIIYINFLSAVYSVSMLLPLLEKNSGVIINVSSSSALCPFAGISAYASSKSALERFSYCLSYEVKNVSVTTVLPGFTKTDVMRSQTSTEKESGVIGRLSANPTKVANKILRKASKRRKRVITGIYAHIMNFLFKFFPSSAPRFNTWFLKKSGYTTFKDIFE